MNRWSVRGLPACAIAAVAVAACGTSQAWAANCATSSTPGGNWPAYGHDLLNTRNQPKEHTIGTRNVASLRPAWRFDTGNSSGIVDGFSDGSYNVFADINSTPTVAGGCVFIGGAAAAEGTSNVFAVNADTGQLVWKAHLDASPAGHGGAVIGSPTVAGRRVIVLVSQVGDGPNALPQSGTVGPYAAAFNRRTGELRWISDPIASGGDYYTNATPTVARGVVIAGFSPPEGDPRGQGGVALLDLRTGALLEHTYTVPPSQWGTEADPEYAGGGVWMTPAVDPQGYAYYGTGNPFSKDIEHPQTNAILKVDIDLTRPTFGEVVASYKGNVDQLNDVLVQASRPTCALLPDNPIRTLPGHDPLTVALKTVLSDTSGCLQLDLDFGASPNLFQAPDGTWMVGDLQKSGVYHTARTGDMSPGWMRLLNVTCILCNAASTAYDAERNAIYANLTPIGQMAALSTTGALKWFMPGVSALNFEAVSIANGVVYLVDALGFLTATDARNGLPLLRRSMVADGADNTIGAINSAGVAIARNTVYAPAGSHVIAYRLP